MNRKPLELLLSISLLIAVFGQHNEVNAQINVDIDSFTEAYGTFLAGKSFPSIQSYARSRNSKTEFAVAFMTPNQKKDDKTGILYQSVLWLNCKDGRVQFYSMEKIPAEDKKRVALEAVKLQAFRFCQFHKQAFKHSYW